MGGNLHCAIDRITRAGLEVKISELDISVYTGDDWASQTWEKEKPFNEEVERRQALRYREQFNLFRSNGGRISGVTLWGVSDDATRTDWIRHKHMKAFNFYKKDDIKHENEKGHGQAC
jgi:GH35 family endo-1,4-beta-xylanase